jgi:hypothetical protein
MNSSGDATTAALVLVGTLALLTVMSALISNVTSRWYPPCGRLVCRILGTCLHGPSNPER